MEEDAAAEAAKFKLLVCMFRTQTRLVMKWTTRELAMKWTKCTLRDLTNILHNFSITNFVKYRLVEIVSQLL